MILICRIKIVKLAQVRCCTIFDILGVGQVEEVDEDLLATCVGV